MLVKHPDEILRKDCRRLTDEVRTEVADRMPAILQMMVTTMVESGGIGLAANQIGEDLNLFVADVGFFPSAMLGSFSVHTYADVHVVVFDDPLLVGVSDKASLLGEGCLSLPGESFLVPRPATVEVEVRTRPHFKRERFQFYGMAARIVCHEIDHLRGRLIADYHLSGEAG